MSNVILCTGNRRYRFNAATTERCPAAEHDGQSGFIQIYKLVHAVAPNDNSFGILTFYCSR